MGVGRDSDYEDKMLPHKISISLWLEPESVTEIDRFCTEHNLNRGRLIRMLLDGHEGMFKKWAEARKQYEAQS